MLLTFAVLLTLSCTEDLGPGKFGNGLVNPQSPAGPTAWATKSTFQLIPASESGSNGGGVDSFGNWYSVGYGVSSGIKSWLVRKSSDNGATWTLVENFNYAAGLESVANGFAADSSGNVYVVGVGVTNPNSPQYYWLVRKSSDGGLTWKTIDAVTGGSGLYSEAAAVTVSPNGRVFVTGSVHDGTRFKWWVRASTNGGTSWSTTSTYVYPGSTLHARGYAAAVDAAGTFYVGGAAQDNTGNFHWLVARSTDNGFNWTTVDDFQLQAGVDSEAKFLAIDKQNRVFSAGFGLSSSSGKHWIVRRSNQNGAAWSTVDDYIYPTDSSTTANTSARSIAIDSRGVAYVAGYGGTFEGSQHYISVVRKSEDAGKTWMTDDTFQPEPNTQDALANTISIDAQNRIFISGNSWIGSYAWFIRSNP